MITPGEAKVIQKRVWIKSGVVENLDERQVRLLDFVLAKIIYYYKHLHGSAPRYRYPLSVARLKKLCNRGGQTIVMAVHYLANTVPLGTSSEPPIFYDRVSALKNKAHRPYRIFLRDIAQSQVT